MWLSSFKSKITALWFNHCAPQRIKKNVKIRKEKMNTSDVAADDDNDGDYIYTVKPVLSSHLKKTKTISFQDQ